ncbi:hypothetical protein ABZY09_35630 [Streptomyces sp. NPDC002928]|uniref:hypothetical protein n=1 Tax=Streptomyces sp. NPDC002928 TaxID=3154440 RepID=UPI0033BE4238
MRISRLVAALGVAAAALLGGATGASAATNAPSVVSHATHDRGHDHWHGDRDGRWDDHHRDNRRWDDRRWDDRRGDDRRWDDRRDDHRWDNRDHRDRWGHDHR